MVNEVGVGREQRRKLEKSACQAEEFSDSKWMPRKKRVSKRRTVQRMR